VFHSHGRRSDLITLGEICNMFNLTPRALRFYEEKGLVRTERNDVGWRSYSPEARRRLDWIAQLRAAGVSLPDIRQVLDADEPSGARAQLALEKLAARREALTRSLAAVEALDARLEAVRKPLAA
jgi:DNA-binding transcriptional MerR regulator